MPGDGEWAILSGAPESQEIKVYCFHFASPGSIVMSVHKFAYNLRYLQTRCQAACTPGTLHCRCWLFVIRCITLSAACAAATTVSHCDPHMIILCHYTPASLLWPVPAWRPPPLHSASSPAIPPDHPPPILPQVHHSDRRLCGSHYLYTLPDSPVNPPP